LTLRTEYSFRKCFLPIKDIHKYVVGGVVGICDEHNTYGHIPLQIEADKHGFTPVFGVRLAVVWPDSDQRKCDHLRCFIATSQTGLRNLNHLVSMAWRQFYYFPRVEPDQIELPGIIEMDAIDNNLYGDVEDRDVYELMAGSHKRGTGYNYNFQRRTWAGHVLDNDFIPPPLERLRIPKGEMVTLPRKGLSIEEMCHLELNAIGHSEDAAYKERLARELSIIKEKGFEDYFRIVADMVAWAKDRMLVGPARGSSAGSLVCYLLGITEVDPIQHNLVFERFIDINRDDLPDIDVDFPDSQRKEVIAYLKKRYGASKVACLANINRFSSKSALNEFAKGLGIPLWELDDIKAAEVDRMRGDEGADHCLADTLQTDAGIALLEKYPQIALAARVEGHASHAGKHAAAVLVATKPLHEYAPINDRDGVVMLDKYTADYLGLLKIDCLGLTTLSILQDTCQQIGMDSKELYRLPLDDRNAYELINRGRLAGIFQFEGQALRNIVAQIEVECFDDLAAITALARPGALNSGGTERYIKAKNGEVDPVYYSSKHRDITGDTFGVIVYQEQMMEIAREIGQMSWEDVSALRKGASKNMGTAFMAQYRDKFMEGAPEECHPLWEEIEASGAWAFNKSHSVGYSLISYWTAVMKAKHPLEFSAAVLNNVRDEDTRLRYLRDVVKNDNIIYSSVDPLRSTEKWSVVNGILLGGLTNIDGIAEISAKRILKSRETGAELTPSLKKKLEDAKTPYDILFPTMDKFCHLFDDPRTYGLESSPTEIKDIRDVGEYIFIGRVLDVTVREEMMRIEVEDDTDIIRCKIDTTHQADFPQIEVGKWYLIRGKIRSEKWRTISVFKIHSLSSASLV
jgi:DNA polymerase III alpha subunit